MMQQDMIWGKKQWCVILFSVDMLQYMQNMCNTLRVKKSPNMWPHGMRKPARMMNI